jgi:hypothetical protein
VWKRNLLFIVLCLAGLAALAGSMAPLAKPIAPRALERRQAVDVDFRHAVDEVNAALRADWQKRHLEPAARADDLLLARRLALGLMGTIPSLEEIRALETSPAGGRIDAWVDRLVADPRHHDYFAERLARAFVGVQDGPFLLYRRRRFVRWLSDRLRDDRPYDATVRELISANGLATSEPATNFMIVTIKPDMQKFHVNESAMAARISRSMLGVRIDCAECHDHPWEPWKQGDFEGLAAFFANTRQAFSGIQDRGQKPYEVEDRVTGDLRDVEPKVPFAAGLLPERGANRERLAAWVTDSHNERFAQAIVNRVWALLFGRGLVEPVDDIRPSQPLPPALEILARDFVAHGHSVRRLIRLIAATEAFQFDSRSNPNIPGHEITAGHEAAWAAFPLHRLRAEQVAGAIEQAASLETLDRESHLILRAARAVNTGDFLKRYGDAGDDELSDNGATIPQRLLLMNGKLVKDRTRQNPLFNAASQIALLSADDGEAVDAAYLTVLSRPPTEPEREHFVARLGDAKRAARYNRLEDLCWTLINSVEFSWNH